jgi:chromosome segregation ATPase
MPNKIPDSDLEEIFHVQLKTFFFSPSEINNYLERADQVIKEKEELLKVLEEEKKKVDAEMKKVYRAYADDVIDIKAYGSQYRPLAARSEQIENQIPELQRQIDFLKIQYLSSDHILNEAKDLYSRWPGLNNEEKRKAVENITERIIVGTDDVAINLCYFPTSPKVMTSEQHNFSRVLHP